MEFKKLQPIQQQFLEDTADLPYQVKQELSYRRKKGRPPVMYDWKSVLETTITLFKPTESFFYDDLIVRYWKKTEVVLTKPQAKKALALAVYLNLAEVDEAGWRYDKNKPYRLTGATTIPEEISAASYNASLENLTFRSYVNKGL